MKPADFGRAVTLNTVHVTFQTKALAASSFRVEVSAGDAWQTVAEVSGEQQRRHVLSFARTRASKLRVVLIEAPVGAGLCQVRAYDEPNTEGQS